MNTLISRRFVCDNDLWISDDGSGDTNQLLLAAGQLILGKGFSYQQFGSGRVSPRPAPLRSGSIALPFPFIKAFSLTG